MTGRELAFQPKLDMIMDKDKIPVSSAPGFLKDMKTGVVINTNMAEYELILTKRRHAEEIGALKDQFEELKEMVLRKINR